MLCSLALNGSFSIYYFIGPKGGAVSMKPQDYSRAPTLAGSTYIFAAPVEACDNCGAQAQQGHRVTDTTPITAMLLDYIKIGELGSLDLADVKPFLVDRLRWRVQTVMFLLNLSLSGMLTGNLGQWCRGGSTVSGGL